jgi:hypothetical protein
VLLSGHELCYAVYDNYNFTILRCDIPVVY